VKIMVVLRMVPDPAGEMEVAANGLELDREWIDLRLNDFDDHALEQAVLIKEATGAEVIAVAAAGDGVDKMLQSAIARGADGVLRLAHDLGDGPSSRALAPLIAELTRQEGVDLVLTGVQTSEDLFGQLAPYVGSLLQWPHLSALSGVEVRDGTIEVLQEQGNGITSRLAVDLPAVLGIQAASQAPRYVSGSKLRQAAGIKIPEVTPDAVALSHTSKVEQLRSPERSGKAKIVTGDAEAIAEGLVCILREHGFLKGISQ
jgi:electron transfer flavoprotein beta subunit